MTSDIQNPVTEWIDFQKARPPAESRGTRTSRQPVPRGHHR